jgi:hypothetical protein
LSYLLSRTFYRAGHSIPPLAFVANDAEPRLVLSEAKDDPSANTHVLNEVKDRRCANPHRDSLVAKTDWLYG